MRRLLFNVMALLGTLTFVHGQPPPATGSNLFEVVIPEYKAEETPFFAVLGDLRYRFGLTFLVEVTVEEEYVEPLVTLDLSNVTLRELLDAVVEAGAIRPGRWQRCDCGAIPEIVTVFLGEFRPSSSPMEVVVKHFEARGDHSPSDLVSALKYWITELREIFIPKGGGIAGSMTGRSRERIWFDVEDMTVREMLRLLSVKYRELSWAFVYVKKDIRKSEWRPFLPRRGKKQWTIR